MESLSCNCCDIRFGSNVDSFVDHMTDSHADDRICCTNCQEITSSGFEYAIHFLQIHHFLNTQSVNSLSAEQMFSCPQCTFSSVNPEDLAIHASALHDIPGDDAAQCLVTSSTVKSYSCVLCGAESDSEFALQVHVNECLDSQKCAGRAEVPNLNDLYVCCICGANLASQNELLSHVEDCLDPENETKRLAEERDRNLAMQIQSEQNSATEQREFKKLKACYGMDERGSYKSQGRTALDRSYYNGQIDLEQYYAGLHRLGIQENIGTEDPNLPLAGLIEAVLAVSFRDKSVHEIKVCENVEHCGSQAADAGFGCGYRNIQMNMSALKHYDMYRSALWKDGPVLLPSIPKIQGLIEDAWNKGFDRIGADQLNHKLRGTRKWIGGTEIAALLSSFKIKCRIIDFHRPTGPNRTHPELFRWAWNYFSTASPVLPIYIQHEGHSRTLIGVERTNSGYRLLILDPSLRRARLQEFVEKPNANQGETVLKLLRKSECDMKNKQYQLVIAEGIMNDQEYENAKRGWTVEKIPRNDS